MEPARGAQRRERVPLRLGCGASQQRSARGRRDAGDTLIEILLTVVLTGITVGALLLSLANAGNAGIAQRGMVTADVVMRNYAEAVKAAAQACTGGALGVDFTPRAGYIASIINPGTSPVCPSPLAPTVLMLQVIGPRGIHQTMQVEVRSP